MAGMKTLEENIERLEAAIKRAEEMSREANSAAKAARDAKRELEGLEQGIVERVKTEIENQFGQLVKEGLEDYSDTLGKAAQDGYKHVIEEFDKVKNIMVFGNEKGKGPTIVEDWVRKVVKEELAFVMRQN